jgi:hypothetical protein
MCGLPNSKPPISLLGKVLCYRDNLPVPLPQTLFSLDFIKYMYILMDWLTDSQSAVKWLGHGY